MSKADNKELEEAINFIKYFLRQYYNEDIAIEDDFKFEKAIKIALNELKSLQQENKDLKKANTEKANKLIEITDLYMKSVLKDEIRKG